MEAFLNSNIIGLVSIVTVLLILILYGVYRFGKHIGYLQGLSESTNIMNRYLQNINNIKEDLYKKTNIISSEEDNGEM